MLPAPVAGNTISYTSSLEYPFLMAALTFSKMRTHSSSGQSVRHRVEEVRAGAHQRLRREEVVGGPRHPRVEALARAAVRAGDVGKVLHDEPGHGGQVRVFGQQPRRVEAVGAAYIDEQRGRAGHVGAV